MKSPIKIGIVAALGVIAVPSAVIGSGGIGSSTPKIKDVPNTLARAGYSKKDSDKLIDFNKDRDSNDGGNFALGCHRLIFEGKNTRKLSDGYGGISDVLNEPPISKYLGDEKEPVLACSTASSMKDYASRGVYEYELAIKRGDIGFLERITVWKDDKKAISQLVLYKKNDDPRTKSTHPWTNWYGVQRGIYQSEFEITNPGQEKWIELKNLNTTEENQPRYFSVWISDFRGKGMLENLGVRVKSDKRWFSSIAKAKNDTEWNFKFFGRDDSNKTELKVRANNPKNKANYTSLIANEVASFKGNWQGVKEFCEAQKITDDSSLTKDEFERLKNYCYTNRQSR